MFGLVRLEPIWEMFFCIIYEFSFVFGLISRKREEISKNLGKVGGPSPRQRDLSPRRRPTLRHGMACRGVVEKRIFPSLGSQR